MPAKKAQSTVAGMYLWEVEYVYKNYLGDPYHKTLLVLTRSDSLKQATQKAENHLKKISRDWDRKWFKIDSVQQKGQIDA